MANIDTLLQQILAAVYGEDVRGSIHDAIAAMNEESSEAISVSKTAQDSAKNSADAAAKSATDAADAVADLDNKHTSAVDAVTAAKTDALSAISVDQKSAEDAITAKKNTSLGEIDDKTAASVNTLTNISNSTEAFKTLAQSYAEGGTGTRDGEDTANAKYYMEQAQKIALGNLDDKMSDTSENAVKNMVIKAYVDGKTPATATADTLGIVKPDNSTITIDEDGTLHGSAKVAIATTEALGIVKPDGDTITIDEDGTIHCTPSVLQLKITFAEAFKGAQYTITGGSESYSGAVPDSLQVVQKVEAYNTTYTISSTANGTKYSTTAATEKFAGEYTAELSAFTATINVTVTAAGAKVSGATATATLNGKTYTATTNSSGVAAVKVYSAGTYAISATYRDYAETSGSSVAISTNEQIASGSVAIFGATLTVDADISGRTSSATNTITVTDGTHKQTATITANGSKVFTIYYAGTYTVSMTNGTDTSASVSVDCKTDGGTPSASISYFKATLTVKVINGNGATVTATDGAGHTYTGTATSGSVAMTVYAAGTYTVSAELSGETGALTASVTVDTDGGSYTANVGFASTTLNDNSWEIIHYLSQQGTAEQYFAVGDVKKVHVEGTVGTLAVNDDYNVYILGFDHNSDVEGKGVHFGCFKTTAGVDICLTDGVYKSSQTNGNKYFNMNHSSNTNAGGWKKSNIRYDVIGSTNSNQADAPDDTATNPVAGTLMAALPEDLRTVMQPMTKYSDNNGGGSDTAGYVTATKDFLWLLSEFEVQGARTYANSAEKNYQKQYQYYVNGNSKVKYQHNATTSTAIWWLRSVTSGSTGGFCGVNTNGGTNTIAACDSYGLAPAFAV